MPTFHIGGFKMRFYSNDHTPAHVHCINGDGVVVVDIATGAVRSVKGGIRDPDIARAVNLVEEHRDRLTREWTAFDLRRHR